MWRPIFTQQLRLLDISLRIHNQVELWLWNCNKAGNGVGTNPKKASSHWQTPQQMLFCENYLSIAESSAVYAMMGVRNQVGCVLSLNCDDHRNSGNSFLAETGVDDLTNALEICRSNGSVVTRLHNEKENKDQIFLKYNNEVLILPWSPRCNFPNKIFIIW